MKSTIMILLILFCLIGGCVLLLSGSELCTKGDTNQGVFLDFGSAIDYTYAVINSRPGFRPSDKYVKKLIVDNAEGFLLVYEQGAVHCDNSEEMEKNPKTRCKGHKIINSYIVKRYTVKNGYEEWGKGKISEEDWKDVSDLHHSFSIKPDYHYENCRYHFFGDIIMFLKMVSRI